MLILLFLIGCIRIKEVLGEIGLLQYISGSAIHDFLESNQMSIIFYSKPDNKSREELSFTNTAITIYKEIISFALGDPKDAPPSICSKYIQNDTFCVVPYEGSRVIQFEPAPNTAPSFLNWIDLLSHPNISAIFSINKLNRLLNGNESCIFAVDVQEEFFDNIDIPKNKKIYMVSADLFSIYNLTLDQGIYFYRPNDRQILKLDENNKYKSYSSDENMKIQFYQSVETDKNLQNRLICGFTLNESDPILCEEQFKILSSLSKNEGLNEFSSLKIDDMNKYFIFTFVRNENIEDFANLTCMRSVSIPYFFVVNVSNPSRLRWVVDQCDKKAYINTSDHIYNYSYLIEFLNRIILNKEDPYIVSELDLNEAIQFEELKNDQIEKENENNNQLIEQDDNTQKPKRNLKINRRRDNSEEEEDEEQMIDNNIQRYSQVSIQKVVGRTFSDFVFDDYYEALVLFTSPNSTKYKFFKPIVNAVALLLNKTGIRFYYMDVSKNDVPTSVPPIKKFPTLMLWPAGHKDEPIIYQGNNTFIDVLNFVQKHVNHKIKVPHFDLDSIKEKLAAILNKIRFGNHN